jgi:hypothetical protein
MEEQQKAADPAADNKMLRRELDCLRTSHALRVGELAFVTQQRDSLYGALDELRNSMNSEDDKTWRGAAYARACLVLSKTTKSPPGDEIANLGIIVGNVA